jgi:hypothetical protein
VISTTGPVLGWKRDKVAEGGARERIREWRQCPLKNLCAFAPPDETNNQALTGREGTHAKTKRWERRDKGAK